MVEGIIKRHYRCSSIQFIYPIHEDQFKTIRRGLRWVETNAGWGKTTSDEVLWRVLKNLGLTDPLYFEWKPKKG